MKIGIITFHFAYNYGAALQAYAMQEHLKQMGHEAYIIDYAPEYHIRKYSRGRTWNSCFTPPLWQFPVKILIKLFRNLEKGKSKSFEAFKTKHFNLYPYTTTDDFSFFDCVLLGSDQIWRQDITNNCFDGPYYGEGFKCRVFSYAASNRATAISEEEASIYREKLKKLSHIGVRELKLKQLLEDLTHQNITVNLDPTLLAGRKVFENLKLDKPLKDKYVLVYQLPFRPQVVQLAKNYAHKIGAKLVCLVDAPLPFRINNYDQTAGPENFLAYIKHAECVFTTSFHGTALSLIFKKDFFSIKQHTSADIRISYLLDQVGLKERFIEMQQPIEAKKIDYTDVNDKLEMLRISSQDFLESAINNKRYE